jgi:hypothetical protein
VGITSRSKISHATLDETLILALSATYLYAPHDTRDLPNSKYRSLATGFELIPEHLAVVMVPNRPSRQQHQGVKRYATQLCNRLSCHDPP